MTSVVSDVQYWPPKLPSPGLSVPLTEVQVQI